MEEPAPYQPPDNQTTDEQTLDVSGETAPSDIVIPDDCVPSCAMKQCGDNGCGSVCGKCKAGEQCENFTCVAVGAECDDTDGVDWDGCTNGFLSEMQVNIETDRDQRRPTAALLNDSNIAVFWQSCPTFWDDYQGESQDHSGCGVFGRILTAGLVPVTDEIAVNDVDTENHQQWPMVSAFNGGFAVTWQSWSEEEHWVVKVRLFENMGFPTGSEFDVKESLQDPLWGAEMASSVAARSGEGESNLVWMAVWKPTWGNETFDQFLAGQAYEQTEPGLYSTYGSTLHFFDGQPTCEEYNPALAIIPDGRLLLVYDYQVDQDNTAVGAQLLDLSAAPAQAPKEMPLPVGSARGPLSILPLAGGQGFIMASYDPEADDFNGGVVLHGFDFAGKATFGRFEIPHAVDGLMERPAIAIAGTERLIVARQKRSADTYPDPTDVFAQVWDIVPETGEPEEAVADEIVANRYTTGSQAWAQAVGTWEEDFILFWESCPSNVSVEPELDPIPGQDGWGCGIFAQRVSAQGSKVAPEIRGGQ
jgi:hypothetical protein